jgi:hypothetical protein
MMSFKPDSAKLDKAVGLLVFDSTNVALKTERTLKEAGVPCAVIPTPVEITSDCGISLLLRGAWVEKAKEALASAGFEGHSLVHPFERRRPESEGG